MVQQTLLAYFIIACLIILDNTGAAPIEMTAEVQDNIDYVKDSQDQEYNKRNLKPNEEEPNNTLSSSESEFDKTQNKSHTVLRNLQLQLNRHVKNYYPGKKLSTVCLDRSTLYNIPKVKDWLGRHLANTYPWGHYGWRRFMDNRPLFMTLRRQIFEQGRAEECHIKENNTWRKFLECALTRNMRVEYLIPQYPLHQIRYHFLTDIYTPVFPKD